jgi:phosphatidylglycerol:prolipoprotein diacylglycerol transferase
MMSYFISQHQFKKFMYPNLYFIIEGLLGVKPPVWFSIVQTFGLFLAFTFISAGIVLASDMKRRTALGQFKPVVSEREITGTPSIGDLIINGLIGFILGFKLLFIAMDWSAFTANPQDVILSTKGHIAGGIIGGLLMMASKYWERRKEAAANKGATKIRMTTQPYEMVGDILIVAAISGLIGAKIFAVMEYPQRLIEDPIGQLLSGSGLAIYGGLVFGFLGVFYYIHKKGLSKLHMMDAAAPPLILGYGVGRMGCHFSGDGDWGIVNANPKPSWLPDWMWALKYPHNVNGEGVLIEGCKGEFYTDQYCYELPEGVYPTSVYEILAMLVLFAIFWFVLRFRFQAAGLIFFAYMIVNGIERYLIEIIRVNDRYDWFFNMTQAQMVAVFMMLIGVLGSIWAVRRHRANPKL